MLGNRTLFPRVEAGMERQNDSNRSDHPSGVGTETWIRV